MITGIAHNAVKVTNMEATLDFYCNKLGFKKAFEIADDNNNPWIVYVKIRDGQFIEFFYDGLKEQKSNFMHVCLECDDVYKTVDELIEKGVEIDVMPSQGKDLNYQAWIHDPDGNKIELMTIDPNSPQAKA